MGLQFSEKFQKNPNIDYQLKLDELLKETIFLQKYSPVDKWQEEELKQEKERME